MVSRQIPVPARKKKRRPSAAVLSVPSPVEQEEEDQPDNRGNCLLIVGVGASAGGLEAFTQLLKHLPLDTGMAFVL
ncbi:MAG: chemotaxis protein CheB, partial [Nitrospirota bacterium]